MVLMDKTGQIVMAEDSLQMYLLSFDLDSNARGMSGTDVREYIRLDFQ